MARKYIYADDTSVCYLKNFERIAEVEIREKAELIYIYILIYHNSYSNRFRE